MFSILTSTGVFLLVLVTKCLAEQQIPLSHVSSEVNHLSDPTWAEKYGDQYDQPFSGPLSFSHLPYHKCLEDTAAPDFDIAILGLPFDTGVSYRPGARFGPFAIRSGSRRQRGGRGYSLSWGLNPYLEGNIVDCGDVPVNPFDNHLAVDQIEVAYSTLLRRVSNPDLNGPMHTTLLAKDGLEHPRIVSLGGDHTIVLPILRSLNKIYGPVAVIHFDAHLDTWRDYPAKGSTEQSRVTHGTFFSLAQEEGLIANNSIHAGIRCKILVTPPNPLLSNYILMSSE
jgi:agmatinase